MNVEQRKTFDLEDRLIDFAVRMIHAAESLPTTKVGNHISGQLIRCGTSPAPTVSLRSNVLFEQFFREPL